MNWCSGFVLFITIQFLAAYSVEENEFFEFIELSTTTLGTTSTCENGTETQCEKPLLSNQTFLFEGEVYESHCPANLDDGENVLIKGEPRGVLICKQGFYRVNSDDCVMLQDCPNICSENEILVKITYSSNVIPKDKPTYKCACKEGYERNKDNKCVSKLLPCGPNSKRVDCGTACPITCKNFLYPRQQCALPCIPDSCVCYDGFVLNDEGICVPPSECPDGFLCPANSEWRMCVNPNPITCDMLTRKQVPDCSKTCPAAFTCQCKVGYVHRSANDTTCIPVEQCFMKVYPTKKMTFTPIYYSAGPAQTVHHIPRIVHQNHIPEDPKLCLFPGLQ